jgi:hypothetical protein
MKIPCPFCTQEFLYDPELAGRTFACSYCKKALLMPSLQQLPIEYQEQQFREEQDHLRKKLKQEQKQEAQRQKLEKQERERQYQERLKEEEQARVRFQEEQARARLQKKQSYSAECEAQPPRTPHMLGGHGGKTVIVDGATIRIISEGWLLASNREKALLIRNITAVEVKEPGVFFAGFIQFSIPGDVQDPDAIEDENLVEFYDEEAYQTALKIKEYVETYQERSVSASSAVSAADEIVKLKALMDQGILSREEFETKKRRLIES